MRALGRTLVVVPRVFAADLGREHGFSTSEYSVLMALSESAEGRLRMGELARAAGLTLGAVTRIAKLLESKGWVERRPSEEDGRGHDALLTPVGVERLEALGPAYVASARRRVLDKLAGLDLAACTQALTRISDDA